MNYYFKNFFFDWIEVWALLIPLFFITSAKTSPVYMKPVKIYVVAAFIINLLITLIWKRNKLGITLPDWLHSNNFLYNINSLVRLILFSLFFILLKQRFMHRVKIILPVAFLIFVIAYFSFYEDFFNYNVFSSLLLAIEAALLLFYCLQYFIYMVLESKSASLKKHPHFWVVTGLSIYVAVSFLIFLFFDYLTKYNQLFARNIWYIHNVAFLILCIFLARAFYEKTD